LRDRLKDTDFETSDSYRGTTRAELELELPVGMQHAPPGESVTAWRGPDHTIPLGAVLI